MMSYKCPYCEIRLKPAGDKFRCGICGSTFDAGQLTGNKPQGEDKDTVDFAKEYLKAQKQADDDSKGDLKILHTDTLLHIPQWKLWLNFLGVPIEEENEHTDFPIVITFYVLVCCALFFVGQKFSLILALDPTQLSKLGGATFFTYSLVHIDFMHLLGNMIFILPFAENVEHRLGARETFLFILVSALSSAFLHLVLDRSGLPLLGASGVCFAVVTFYAVKFPHNRLLVIPPFIGLFAIRYRLRVRARTFAIFYLVKEAGGIYFQLTGNSEISHLGHIGGALSALAFCALVDDENV